MGKKILSIILSIAIILSSFPANVFAIKAYAANAEYKIEIVSFARGEKDDLRSSELLEARLYVRNDNGSTWEVTDNYNGTPITQLNYTWTNNIGTYLYVYNSHNMYGINNTSGEKEIDTGSKSTGTGFAWAAIYGANIDQTDLLGTINVVVKDRNGQKIGEDSHTGSREKTGGTNYRPVYTYSGILMPNLEEDIGAIGFGLFEGDKKRVLDMLGEAGIVHITCTACSVSNLKVIPNNSKNITIDNSGVATATSPGENTTGGDAAIQLTIKKQNCKFHQYLTGGGNINVYVYKKPKTTTTATTLTLTNLDERCTYYIDGVQGRKVEVGNDDDITNDYIIFEGLSPNTDYTVMAKGQTGDTDAVYAYVYDRTKPSLTGTIRVLNHTNKDTGGILTDITDMYLDGKIVFRLAGDLANIETRRTGEGVYSAILSTGTFYPWYTLDGTTYIQGNQQLVVTDRNVESTIHFYEVSYDLKGGSVETSVGSKTHISGEKVMVYSEMPVRRGYVFAGWKDQYGDLHKPGAVLANNISKPYLLEAQWEEAADVYLNVTIDHTAGVGHDYRDDRGDIRLRLVAAEYEDAPFLQTGDEITLTDTSHDKHIYTFNSETITTYYDSNTATFEDVPKDAIYSIVVDKSGYYIESITNSKNDDGDWTINVKMKYEPQTQLLDFEVKVDDNVPDNLLPQAAIVKVLFWERTTESWKIITQHEGMKPGVRVNFNDRLGKGSYPVWVYDDEDDKLPYYYRIVVTSLVYPDGKIVAMNEDVLKNLTKNKTDLYDVTIGAYEGVKPSASEHEGAYFVETSAVVKQNGLLDAVITATGYDVNFDAQGGKVNGYDKQTVKNQYKVPEFENYVPTRDGGYIFNGWYKDAECTTPAVEGEYLSKNITLYAKWTEPLKISGNITVDGTYMLGNNLHTIHDADRAKNVIVLLQKVKDDEIINVASKDVTITYENNKGKGTFTFDGIEDNDDNYRIVVYSANYDSLYRNEPETENFSEDKADYNSSDFNAEFGGDKIAKIDTYLTFNPQSFPLKYEIDVTAIGAAYRPTAAEVLVLYDDGLKGQNPLYWAVISQMVQGNNFFGQDTLLSNGIGNNEYSVWNQKTSGGAYYDYAIKLNKYTPANGEEKNFDGDNEPFTIEYNGYAHYDSMRGQSQILKAILEPKEYRVTFNLEFEENDSDNIGESMDSYRKTDGTYSTVHKWSYVTNIDAVPERNGYEFKGWFIDEDNNGVRDEGETYVTEIAAEVYNDVILTAEWEELPDIYVDVIINHKEKIGTGNNNDKGKHNITFTVDQKNLGLGGDYTEIFEKTISWDGTEELKVDGYTASFDGSKQQTIYIATKPTLKAQKKAMSYTVTTAKHGYSVDEIKTETDENGNLRLTVTLFYDPNNFDFKYNVELDENAKELPDNLKPKAVNVKVTSWYDTPNDTDFGDPVDFVQTAWYTITQHRDSYQRVELNEDGKGNASYPVWMNATVGENQVPYYYRIEVVSYELADRTILPVNNLEDNQPSVDNTYTTAGGIYTATINTADGCEDPDGTGSNTLDGAYYSNENDQKGQVGTVKAVISINTYNITVDPAGGKFRDGTTEEKVLENLIQMPDISGYVPTKEGYTFNGWVWADGSAENADNVQPLSKGDLMTEDLYLKATWVPVSYTITYVTNEGNLPSDESITKTYTINDAVTHPIPTRADYIFAGWYDNRTFAGEPEASFDAGQIGDKVYYAKWEYGKASLTIHKTFKMGTKADNQPFIFHIYNEDKGIDMKVSIKGSGTITINDLPKDANYIVTEEMDWSWRYQPNKISQNVDLSKSNNSVTFINEKTSDNWINAFSKVLNRFK